MLIHCLGGGKGIEETDGIRREGFRAANTAEAPLPRLTIFEATAGLSLRRLVVEPELAILDRRDVATSSTIASAFTESLYTVADCSATLS